MPMKFKEWALFFCIIIGIWALAGMYIHNPIILPMPTEVIKQMILQVSSASFYKALLSTLVRAFLSILISLMAAFIFSFYARNHEMFYRFFEKALVIVRSIPNVTFVILLMFWVKREISVYIVAFLLLFPVLFDILYQALIEIETKWKDVFILYPQRFLSRFKYVYLPLLKSPLKAGMSSAASLSFKVCVMAEILASVSSGIGRGMQLDRLDLNLAGVMAWTIWLLICVYIFNKLILKILDYLCR